MNYCEKTGASLQDLEALGVDTGAYREPCAKYFVECCLNDMLRHAGAYSELSFHYDARTGERTIISRYNHPEEETKVTVIPITEAPGLLWVAYQVIREALFGDTEGTEPEREAAADE